MTGPNPDSIYPNPAIRQVVFIKNVITRPNISVGAYTYYDDPEGAENFEAHVTHHYEFLGDKLIIGKFCAIARGIEFIMNGAIIGANSVVTKDVPAYTIAGGNPCRVIRKRFSEELIAYLEEIRWWNWDADKIFRNMDALCSGDLEKIRRIQA